MKKKIKEKLFVGKLLFLIYLKFKSFKISNFTCLIILFKLQIEKTLKYIYIYIYIYIFFFFVEKTHK